jgi:hypothetical protein
MRTWFKIAGGVAVVVVSFLITHWAINYWSPLPCAGSEDLKMPFVKSSGFAYSASIPQFSSFSNDMQHLARSPLKLCENGRPIGPPHVALANIAANGKGSFVHWGDSVFFSTSDNTDPNTNGRRYSVLP